MPAWRKPVPRALERSLSLLSGLPPRRLFVQLPQMGFDGVHALVPCEPFANAGAACLALGPPLGRMRNDGEKVMTEQQQVRFGLPWPARRFLFADPIVAKLNDLGRQEIRIGVVAEVQ